MNYDLFNQGPEPVIELRDYQQQAHDAALPLLLSKKHALIIQPTGTGKTVVIGGIIKSFNERGKRTLTLAHRYELIEQAADKINLVTGKTCGIEQGRRTANGEENVIASVQSLVRRLDKFKRDEFALIITDEAHHGVAKSYKDIYDYFNAVRLGVTATPDRADERELKTLYDAVAYQYALDQAMKDGWCTRIEGIKPEGIVIDLAGIRKIGGDLSAGDLDTMMVEHLEPMAAAIADKARGKTLSFWPGVASANLMATILKERYGIKSAALSGSVDLSIRENILEQFRIGKKDHLANCLLYTEGFDEPSIETVVMARPTTSRSLYAQCIGRGLRPYPGKDKLLLIEFTCNSEKFDLVEPYELFSCQKMPKRLQKLAGDLAKNGSADYLELLERARDYLERNLDQVVARNFTNFRTFDPTAFAAARKIDIDGELNFDWEGDKISKRQFGYLRAAGFDRVLLESMTKGQASALIAQIVKDTGGGNVHNYCEKWLKSELRKLKE